MLKSVIIAFECILPGFDDDEEDETLPGFDNDEEDTILSRANRSKEDQYTNVLNNLRMENEQDGKDNNELLEEKVEYPELDINSIIKPNQKST